MNLLSEKNLRQFEIAFIMLSILLFVFGAFGKQYHLYDFSYYAFVLLSIGSVMLANLCNSIRESKIQQVKVLGIMGVISFICGFVMFFI